MTSETASSQVDGESQKNLSGDDSRIWTKALSKLITGTKELDVLLALKEVHALLLQRPTLQSRERRVALDTYASIKMKDGSDVWSENAHRMYTTLISRFFADDGNEGIPFDPPETPFEPSPQTPAVSQQPSSNTNAQLDISPSQSNTMQWMMLSRQGSDLFEHQGPEAPLFTGSTAPVDVAISTSEDVQPPVVHRIRTSKTMPNFSAADSSDPVSFENKAVDSNVDKAIEKDTALEPKPHKIRTSKVAPGSILQNTASDSGRAIAVAEGKKRSKSTGGPSQSSVHSPKKKAAKTAANDNEPTPNENEAQPQEDANILPVPEEEQQKKKGKPKVEGDDLYFAPRTVATIMKRILPKEAKIDDDAKELMLECITEFLLYTTSEANSIRLSQDKGAFLDHDCISEAFESLGFENYAAVTDTFWARISPFFVKKKKVPTKKRENVEGMSGSTPKKKDDSEVVAVSEQQ